MYYEEKVINGRLHFRHSSKSEWIPMSAEELTNRLRVAEESLKVIDNKLDEILKRKTIF